MKKKFAVLFLLVVILIFGIGFISQRIILPGSGQRATVYLPVTNPVNPANAWNFEGVSPQTPAVGSATFGTGASANYKVRTTGGPVGKYITVDQAHSGFQIGTMPTSGTGFTAEMLWRPTWVGVGDVFTTGDNSFTMGMKYPINSGDNSEPFLSFSAKINGTVQTLKVPLDGTGPRSFDYWNTQLRYVAFVAGNGEMRIYIDGVSPAGFSMPATGSMTLSGANLFFNQNSYYPTRGDFDEISFYNSALTPNLIYQHKVDMIDNHVHATTTTNLTTVPNPGPVDGPRDINQYLPGAIFTGAYTTYSGSVPTPLEQYVNGPQPRYKPGHQMYPIPNGNNLEYMARIGINDYSGNIDNSLDGYRLKLAKDMNLELAQNWNHFLFVGRFTSGVSGPNSGEIDDALVNPKEYMYQFIKQANDHPELQTSIVTARAQVGRGVQTPYNPNEQLCANLHTEYNPDIYVSGPCIDYQGFPADHYLRTGSGSGGYPIDGNGSNNTGSSSPVRRPLLTNAIDYKPDGDRVAAALTKVVAALPNRATPKINFDHEDFEEATLIRQLAAVKDPDVMAKVQEMFGNTSTNSLFKYLGHDYANYENVSYVNPIMAVPGLQGMGFSGFRLDGLPATDGDFIQFDYSESRAAMRPGAGKLRPMPRNYAIRPSFIANQVAQYSGTWYTKKAVVNQVNNGDSYMLANASNGWSSKEHENVTPGEYLGELKNLTAMGSESVVAFYFWITGNTTSLVETHGYIEMLPALAQAPISYVEDLYKNSYLIGDEPTGSLFGTWDTTNTASMLTDSPQKQVSVRKSNNSDVYLIGGSLMSYDDGNRAGAVREVAPAIFKINGQEITVDVRPQGSYYKYDNTNPNAPIFYQLDKSDENKHPNNWSKNIAIEAEVYDSGSPTLHTEGGGVATRNFSNGQYDTTISATSGSTVGYNFKTRTTNTPTNKTYYLWYRAKASSGTSATSQVKVDSGTPVTISAGTNFSWCNKNSDNTPISFTVAQNVNHTFNFISQNSNFYFDQFILTENPSLGLGTCSVVVPTNTTPTVTITTPATATYTSTSATLALAGTAADVDAGDSVTTVAWTNSVGGTVVSSGTATGTASWSIPSVALQSGVNTITVSATDTHAATGTDVVAVTYSVDTTGPTVNVTVPASGATLTGTTTITATATDTNGVNHVDFYYQKDTTSPVLIPGTASVSGSTYSITWNTATSATLNGAYTITAKAYDNASPSNSTTSTAVAVTLYNSGNSVDTTAPTVAWNAPTAGSTVGGTVNLSANATDPGTDATGVAYVTFKYKLSTAGTWTTLGNSTGSGGVYQYAWGTAALPNSTYNLRAEAVDGATTPNSAYTDITVTVNNTISLPDMVVTDISWSPSAPTPGAAVTFSATIQNIGTAPTPAGVINGVRFLVNGGIITLYSDNHNTSIAPGASVTVTANSGTWSAVIGSISIVATVDDVNRYAESNEANNVLTETMTVAAGPSISLTAPVNGAQVTIGSPVTLAGTASAGITSVGFYGLNNITGIWVRICKSTQAPFTCTWNVGTGQSQKSLRAVGFNASGVAIATSPTVIVTKVGSTPVAACNDEVDNDADGLIDYPADPGCTSGTDTNESNVVADTTPPSTPTNLAAPTKTSTSVSLSWTASTDNISVAGYQVFKNGTLVGTTSTSTYSATGLTANTTYSFTVKAYDTASPANYSNSSTALSVTTNPVTVNNAPIVQSGYDLSNAPGSDTVTLGTPAIGAYVTDVDGPAPLTLLWTKVSGPGNVTFANPNVLTTLATFSQPGNYYVRLTATDGAGASANDQSLIVID